MELLERYGFVMLITVLVTLITLGTVLTWKEQRRLDERLLLEKHYQEVIVPMMLKEKVPFTPQIMLHHRESALSK